MKRDLKIHIYPKKEKSNSKGLMPIYFRITIKSKRFEFSSKNYIPENVWDKNKQRIISNRKEFGQINQTIEQIINDIKDSQYKLKYLNIELTKENFEKEWNGVSQTTRTIVPIFLDHNNKIELMLNKEFAPGTLKRYKISLNHLKEFLLFQYKCSDIDIEKINHSFIQDYDFFLRTKKQCANNSALNHIKILKKIIRICLANDWIQRDPFVQFKGKVTEVEREFLSEEDLLQMKNKNLHTLRLELVRDIFLFSCYTGLAYIDIKNLTSSNIVKGMDGQYWIHTFRQKTDTASKIPILEDAQRILDKYKGNPKAEYAGHLLPILTNQKMNAYLKEIADLCGIAKNLTFHCARHTFATTVTLSNGVPIETVSKMLGHTNIRTTQHYAKITDKKVSQDMELLKRKLQS